MKAMNKRPLFILGTVILIALGAFFVVRYAEDARVAREVAAEEEAVREVVEILGSRLQMVPLAAEKEIAAESMRENYKDLLSESLLEEWASDPSKALGRMVSSPWPDRIEIVSMEKTGEGAYRVKGTIVEMTSAEVTAGGAAARRPIDLIVEENEAGEWHITGTIVSAYQDEESGLSVSSSDTSIAAFRSGIEGKVMLGPTCPVVQEGREEECADRPFETALAVKRMSDGREVLRFSSNAEGEFHVALAPGTYSIGSASGGILPVCAANVEVLPDEFTKTIVNCDSGIR